MRRQAVGTTGRRAGGQALHVCARRCRIRLDKEVKGCGEKWAGGMWNKSFREKCRLVKWNTFRSGKAGGCQGDKSDNGCPK